MVGTLTAATAGTIAAIASAAASAAGAIGGGIAHGAKASKENEQAQKKNRMLAQQRLGSVWTGMNPGAEMAAEKDVGAEGFGGALIGAKAGSDLAKSGIDIYKGVKDLNIKAPEVTPTAKAPEPPTDVPATYPMDYNSNLKPQTLNYNTNLQPQISEMPAEGLDFYGRPIQKGNVWAQVGSLKGR